MCWKYRPEVQAGPLERRFYAGSTCRIQPLSQLGSPTVPAEPERGYELFEHTAEMGVRAWGRDLPEAFAEAARGMAAVMVDLEAVEERLSRRVEAEAEDAGALLVRFLNELVFLVDTEGLVFSRFDIERFEHWRTAAIAHGEQIDRARHQPRAEVKSATYHGLEVEEGPPARVQVILDI